LRYLSGNAAIVEDIVIPQALFPDLQLTPGSAFSDELYVLYQKTYAVTVHKTREAVRAGTASDAEAELLGIAAGAPMIEVDRIAVALDGSRVEWRVSRCRGAGYYYKNDIG
jgi:GntR family transcriptional regulator